MGRARGAKKPRASPIIQSVGAKYCSTYPSTPTTSGPSLWFWLGPLVVGVLGYVLQYFAPTDWMIGDARGFFAPLARPMPLDYAGLDRKSVVQAVRATRA